MLQAILSKYLFNALLLAIVSIGYGFLTPVHQIFKKFLAIQAISKKCGHY
jgi:hypothetical protein